MAENKTIDVTLKIPETLYLDLKDVATELGLSVETLLEQEMEQIANTVSVWLQRGEMLQQAAIRNH
jgi:antitoxin component of RelBE/YafQ-DinJ toxin-antitoxin module